MPSLTVGVFPTEPTRWVAVINAPEGHFSTEVTSAELVGAEVARVIHEVLGGDLPHELVDEGGGPWDADVARRQMTCLLSREG